MSDENKIAKYSFTGYFIDEVLRKRPYIKKEWCVRIVENYEKMEAQESNRFRFWGRIPEYDNRYFRVVTLEDKVTIHNAFPDRRFKL